MDGTDSNMLRLNPEQTAELRKSQTSLLSLTSDESALPINDVSR